MQSSARCLCTCLLAALTCLAVSGCSTTPQPVTNPFPTPPASLMQRPSPLKTLPSPSQQTTALPTKPQRGS